MKFTLVFIILVILVTTVQCGVLADQASSITIIPAGPGPSDGNFSSVHGGPGRTMNGTMTAEMGEHLVALFEEKGVDASELKEAIGNDDRDRIRAIMEEHRELMPAPDMNRTGRQERPGEIEPGFSRDGMTREPPEQISPESPVSTEPVTTGQQSPISSLTVLFGMIAAVTCLLCFRHR